MLVKLFNKKTAYIITCLALFFCCLFMYNAYKCFNGYIANGFRYGLMMPTMISSYLTPVICFLCYFYNYYVKEFTSKGKWIYSSIIISLCLFNLFGITLNFDIYYRNNLLGVYESIPSIILAFPFDAIIFNIFLLIIQVVNILYLINKAPKCLLKLKELFSNQGLITIYQKTYGTISVLALFSFIFFADVLCAFQAIENALYDIKYILLLIWLMFIPLGNLLLIVLKPELRNISKTSKYKYLIYAIIVNILLLVLLLILELIYPSFMVDISKPLFPVTYLISIPFEVIVIIIIQISCSIIYYSRIKKLKQKNN